MVKKLRFLPILLVLLVMVCAASSSGGKTEAGNKIADGIFLGDQDLSGKTMNEAADAMEAYYEKIAASNLTIQVRKIPSDVAKKMEAGETVDVSKYDVINTVKVPVSTFGFDYSIEEALRVASTLGQTGKLVERYKALMNMKYGSAQLPLSYSVDGDKVKQYVDKTFAPANTKTAVDAKFSWGKDGLQIRQKEQDGIKVYNNLTINSILKAFDEGISDKMTCSAVVGVTPASVTSDSLKNINFTKVATYTTKFTRNEDNWHRGHNIDLAAKYTNGTMINPGQRVSLNQVIGRRTEERGFLDAHAFVAGRIVTDTGGGVCQFATTFYQCLLQTELQVNVRYNHSLAVDYVPYSQDATLDWGYCDLIFTNTWKHPIYVECSTTTYSVTVTFYGVDERPKNRTVEYKTVVDEKTETIYPAIVLDSEKSPAAPTRDNSRHDAVKSHVEKIVRVNGVVQSTTIMNNDTYRALRDNVTVNCKGLTLKVKRENDIDKIYDANGNQLLMNKRYEPIYNGHGGYYLAKDYKHDANGVALYNGNKLIPIGSGGSTHTHSYTWTSNNNGTHNGVCSCGNKITNEACTYSGGKCSKCGYTKPTETQPSTETPTQPPTEPHTEAPTEPPTQAHEHSWGAWSAWTHINNSSPSKHYRTRTCTSCSDGTQREEYNCTFDKVVVVEPTTTTGGYTRHTCSTCGFYYDDNYKDPIQPTTEAPTQAPTEPPTQAEGGTP